jgi:hypothetical protein
MSAPMIAFQPVYNRLSRFWSNMRAPASQAIVLPPAQVHNVETMPEVRPRTLKHLLKANHVNCSLYNEARHRNQTPHLLGSVYMLGGSVEQLHKASEAETKLQTDWQDPPTNISESNWRHHLGRWDYQRGYVDFFEDELALNYGYDWALVVEAYLFRGPNPLFNGILGDCELPDCLAPCVDLVVGHPIIHLAYAYELSSREVAMEAMAMAACEYASSHVWLDDPSYTRQPKQKSSSMELLERMRVDDRLQKCAASKNVLKDFEPVVLEYWNAWTVKDPKDFEESMKTATALSMATISRGSPDFQLTTTHCLVIAHAIRVLLPVLPDHCHMALVRQWWLMTIHVFLLKDRPAISDLHILGVDTKGRTWKDITHAALAAPFQDAQFIKVVRAVKECADLWGDPDEWYLKAACKFLDDYDGSWRAS